MTQLNVTKQEMLEIKQSKVELMDLELSTISSDITSTEVCEVITEVYGIVLDHVPIYKRAQNLIDISSLTPEEVSKKVIDAHLTQHGKPLTGMDIRTIINFIFGINLNGISSLEKSGISLFSKGQWISRYDYDLFAVHTGLMDIDVKVCITDRFTELTGLGSLPNELKDSLISHGFTYRTENGDCYLVSSTGDSVADDFKVETMKKIMAVINKSYAHMI
ncbi:hypothetical protein [Halalkalibacter akibai]|uniref:Uncharacterized protein n=1 Tax=Halalkalibacter akibai (strain ATCC 43226 / DSM 21942 / CIP 109018 / JCM 9157 / 1139) TaxID=1236973 RepID=W4QQY3_HALA3|nr:hypothetical protein [Halalkalibacter akibai]GAE34481.1 hypothetical protein JCM9157_1541 [Halalkalibacter akibai JCM 9157]